MDQATIDGLCETYRGMSAEDIEKEIAASKHAGRIPDPAALAAYIVALCEGSEASAVS